MDPMDTATARARLDEIREGLDRSIAVLRGEHPEETTSGYPLDPADAGSNLTEVDRITAILDAAQRQRAEVLDALDRLERGSYGTCVDCGSPVPEGRLEARPEAARCVACQSKLDRQRR
jgi:RNA polymerase-binding transcription factor DksA